MYITIVEFTAFTRECKVSFEESEPLMAYNIRRRIRMICPTSNIKRIRHYEAALVHEEKVVDKNTGDPRTGAMAKTTKTK